MGLGRLEATCEALVRGGRAPTTPAAVVSRATLPDERVVVGTLGDLAELVRAADLPAPALLVVGDVVAQRVVSPGRRPVPVAVPLSSEHAPRERDGEGELGARPRRLG
jgi:uroporphyrin-III C-methyltransferase